MVGLNDGTYPVVYSNTFSVEIQANYAPTFRSDLLDVQVIQGADLFSFGIPDYTDEDGNIPDFTWFETGTTSKPSFIVYEDVSK